MSDPTDDAGLNEEVARNKHLLLETGGGGTYILRSLGSGAEIGRFPKSEEGLESAIDEFDRRTRSERRDRVVPRVLGIVAIVSGTLWAAAGATNSVLFVIATSRPFSASGPFQTATEWIGSATYVLQSFFYSSVAILVVLYIWRRWPTND